jgi:hypothetical protein
MRGSNKDKGKKVVETDVHHIEYLLELKYISKSRI